MAKYEPIKNKLTKESPGGKIPHRNPNAPGFLTATEFCMEKENPLARTQNRYRGAAQNDIQDGALKVSTR